MVNFFVFRRKIKGSAIWYKSPPLYSRNYWVKKVWCTQNRSQYLNLDGSVMNDAQYHQTLEAIYETKATDVTNKLEAGAYRGTGGFKGRGSQSRLMVIKVDLGYCQNQLITEETFYTYFRRFLKRI